MIETPARDFGLPRTLAILAFVALVAYPLSRVLQRADFGGVPPRELWSTAAVSLEQAGWSLAFSLAIGVPLGIFYAGSWSRWLRGLTFAAFSLPALVVVGTAQICLRGTSFRFGLFAVVAAHAFLNAPWIASATAEGILSTPRSWVEAARTLGATRMRAFLRIEFPWIGRRIAIAAAQVFALCLMSFVVVMVLGGGPPMSTLETEIYASVRGRGLELGRAAWFASVELVLAALPLLAVSGLRVPLAFRDSASARRPRKKTSGTRKAFAHAIAAAWTLLPAACFLATSSVRGLEDLLSREDFRGALAVSLRLGFAGAATTIAVGGAFAWGARNSRFVRMLAAVPAGLSPLLVALGFFLAYASFIDPFEGSLAGMVLVQAALFLPFTLRFFLPLLDEASTGSRRELRNAARTLGASPIAAWRKLEWPRWRSAGLRLAALVFVWSFSEVAAASFFGSERLTTLGVLLVRWMAQYRFEDVSAVLFGIYLFSSAVLVAVGFGEREESA